MRRTVFVMGLAILVNAGCCKQQPVKSAADQDCDGCPNIDDLIAERDRLAAENSSLKGLAERRQAIFDQLKQDLAALIEAGKMKIVFRRGMIVMQLPNQVLFRSGSAELTAEGEEVVTLVGEALINIKDRRFLVAGHTDNQPIMASTWQSNWNLSSARAQHVLDVLLDKGVDPSQLAAAGFGEHDPVTNNDASEGQAQNRRTEIMVVPNLERIFSAVK